MVPCVFVMVMRIQGTALDGRGSATLREGVSRMCASPGTFAHRFTQQILYLAGATFIEPAKISTIAVPARTRRASYTGTWPQRRLAVACRSYGSTEPSSKLS